MKKPILVLALAAAFLLSALFLPAGGMKAEEQTIKSIFPDEALRAEVASRLEKGENDLLTDADIASFSNLILKNKGVRNLAGISRLKNLSYLDLGGNSIETLPAEIGRLTGLKLLILDNNVLSELPKEIGSLVNLEVLSASGNALTGLPKEIEELTGLEQLKLSDNRIVELPEGIGDLDKLSVLILEENLLTKLPDSLGRLSRLNVLDLGSNRLTALPLSVSKLDQLYFIDLSKNAIHSIDLQAWQALSGMEGSFLYSQNYQEEGRTKGLVGKDYKLQALDICRLDLGCQVRFTLIRPDGRELEIQPAIAGNQLTIAADLLDIPGRYVLKTDITGGLANLFGDTKTGTEGSVTRQVFQVEEVHSLPGIASGGWVLYAGAGFMAGLAVLVLIRLLRLKGDR